MVTFHVLFDIFQILYATWFLSSFLWVSKICCIVHTCRPEEAGSFFRLLACKIRCRRRKNVAVLREGFSIPQDRKNTMTDWKHLAFLQCTFIEAITTIQVVVPFTTEHADDEIRNAESCSINPNEDGRGRICPCHV